MTLIWLGDETDELKDSFSSIQDARSSFPLTHPATINFPMETFQKTYNCDLSKVTMHLTYRFDWKPIVSMLRLPWFRRKWVI